MFERFTDRSRRVVVVAQQEATLLGSEHTGSEHLLLGLIHDESGIPAAILRSAGVTLEAARAAARQAGSSPGSGPQAHFAFSSEAKRALELSLREALELRQSYIRPEHLLLGLIREGTGAGARILERLAGPLAGLRQQVTDAAAVVPPEPTVPPAPADLSTWPASTRLTRAVRSQTGGLPAPLTGTLAGIHELLASVDRRLAAIERHLGLGDEAAEAPGAPDTPDQPVLQENKLPGPGVAA
jgi:ATP-dependent Clp protease ATP-binding subunit ClpA